MSILRRTVVFVLNRLIYPISPLRWRVGFRYVIAGIAGNLEPELSALSTICRKGGAAIDAGANDGLYAYRLAKRCDMVYAFDANGEVMLPLKQYKHPRIRIEECGLSSASGYATLFIPYSDKMKLLGWASLNPSNCADAVRLEEKQVRLRALDEFDLAQVSFMKIDVEGHERALLEGAKGTIARNRPVVLIEVREENADWVRQYFSRLDYRETSLKEITGRCGGPGNVIYVPAGEMPPH